MTGIVIVSHSAELAEGLRKLAGQMGQGKVPLAAAGGIDDPDEPIGTDAMKILEAIQRVYSEDGVIVFMDMGSAILSTEMALDFLDEDQRSKVVLSPAPLAEGVITAVVTAATGASRQEILRELDHALTGKQSQLDIPPGLLLTPASLYRMRPPISAIPARLPWKTPSDFTPGLQPGWPPSPVNTRPIFSCVTSPGRPTSYLHASINALIGLQAVRQHTLELRAAGNQAAEAFS